MRILLYPHFQIKIYNQRTNIDSTAWPPKRLGGTNKIWGPGIDLHNPCKIFSLRPWFCYLALGLHQYHSPIAYTVCMWQGFVLCLCFDVCFPQTCFICIFVCLCIIFAPNVLNLPSLDCQNQNLFVGVRKYVQPIKTKLDAAKIAFFKMLLILNK